MTTYETNLNQDFDNRKSCRDKTLLNPSVNRKDDYLSWSVRRFEFRNGRLAKTPEAFRFTRVGSFARIP